MQGFGYGNLLTIEALSAGRAAANSTSSDVLRAIVGLLLPILLVGFVVLILMRQSWN